MKRLSHITIIALAVAALMLTGCKNRGNEYIQAMVDELNSPAFRSLEMQTGLFDDCKTELLDRQLTITFVCRSFVSLANLPDDVYRTLEKSAIEEFRTHMQNDRFSKGINALAKADIDLVLVWQDVNGNTVRVPIDPELIINA